VIFKKAARPKRTFVKSSATRKPARSAPAAPRKAPVRAKPEPRQAESEPEQELSRVTPELTAKRKRELRADAHALEPLVHVGHGGVTEAIVRAVSRALRDHELIKVRLHEPEDKRGMADALATGTRAALCGLVGHTVILFRPKPKQKGVSGVARTAIKRNQNKRGRR
jgi:RNA-binding protein